MDNVPGSSSPPASRTVRDGLVAAHWRIEELLVRARDALDAGDDEEHRKRWADALHALSRHMDLEERHLLPRLLGEAARMARTLVAEHTHLRARMVDLGRSCASRVARRGDLSRFLEELCAHERHEESAIYPWADDHLDGIDRDALLAT